MSLTHEQQELIRELAELLAADGFALAGAGGLIDSGILDRATRDIDLFTHLSVDLLAVTDRLVDQFDFAEMVSWAKKADDGFDLTMVADMVRQQRFRPQGRFTESDFATARAVVLEAIERLLDAGHP